MIAKAVAGMPARTIEIEASKNWSIVELSSGIEPAAFVRTLGNVICETQVRLKESSPSYLCGHAAIPPHTDHPDASRIAWFCHAQDDHDGASILVDGWAAYHALPSKQQRILQRISIGCPSRMGMIAHSYKRVVDTSAKSIFFAPWLIPLGMPADQLHVISEFKRIIEQEKSIQTRIRLEPRQILVIDNKRILHARGPLSVTSKRWLTRYWLIGTPINTRGQDRQ